MYGLTLIFTYDPDAFVVVPPPEAESEPTIPSFIQRVETPALPAINTEVTLPKITIPDNP